MKRGVERKYYDLASQAWSEYIGYTDLYEHDAIEVLGPEFTGQIPSLREPNEFERFWAEWLKTENKKAP